MHAQTSKTTSLGGYTVSIASALPESAIPARRLRHRKATHITLEAAASNGKGDRLDRPGQEPQLATASDHLGERIVAVLLPVAMHHATRTHLPLKLVAGVALWIAEDSLNRSSKMQAQQQ